MAENQLDAGLVPAETNGELPALGRSARLRILDTVLQRHRENAEHLSAEDRELLEQLQEVKLRLQSHGITAEHPTLVQQQQEEEQPPGQVRRPRRQSDIEILESRKESLIADKAAAEHALQEAQSSRTQVMAAIRAQTAELRSLQAEIRRLEEEEEETEQRHRERLESYRKGLRDPQGDRASFPSLQDPEEDPRARQLQQQRLFDFLQEQTHLHELRSRLDYRLLTCLQDLGPVAVQAHKGLRICKRTGKLQQKNADHLDKFGKGVRTDAVYELAKFPRDTAGVSLSSVLVLRSVLQNMNSLMEDLKLFSNELRKDSGDALLRAFTSGTESVLRVQRQAEKELLSYLKTSETARKSLHRAEKQCGILQSLREQALANGVLHPQGEDQEHPRLSAAQAQKLFKKLDNQRRQTQKAAQKYTLDLERANAARKALAESFHKIQVLEGHRIASFYKAVYAAVIAERKWLMTVEKRLSKIEQALHEVDPIQDIQSFVEHRVGPIQEEVGLGDLKYDFPYRAHQLSKEMYEQPSRMYDSLDACMEYQRTLFPELGHIEVPLVLHFIICKLEKIGGLTAPGLFDNPSARLLAQGENGPLVNDLHWMEVQIKAHNNYDWDFKWEQSHVLSTALLKWFGSLQEPMIPTILFETCVQVVQNHRGNPPGMIEQIRRTMRQVDHLRLKVLSTLMRFLMKVVARQEENGCDTRLLATVFGPFILRNTEIWVHDQRIPRWDAVVEFCSYLIDYSASIFDDILPEEERHRLLRELEAMEAEAQAEEKEQLYAEQGQGQQQQQQAVEGQLYQLPPKRGFQVDQHHSHPHHHHRQHHQQQEEEEVKMMGPGGFPQLGGDGYVQHAPSAPVFPVDEVEY